MFHHNKNPQIFKYPHIINSHYSRFKLEKIEINIYVSLFINIRLFMFIYLYIPISICQYISIYRSIYLSSLYLFLSSQISRFLIINSLIIK